MELISRQQAIDALRTCYDTETITMDNGDEYINYGDAVGEIEQLSPIQPAEPKIIRCKDCKNWDTTWTNDFSPNYHYCPMVDGVRKEDWFCADAERREVTT